MAAQFTSVKVIPHLEISATGGFDVYWTFTGASYSPTFQVSVADTESGPWTALLTTKTSNSYLLNASTPKVSLQAGMTTWFKVGAYNGSTLQLESPPMDSRAGMDRQQYLYYREMLRRWRVFFAKTVCMDGWLLRRKTFGTRCPECTSQIISTQSSSECDTCYGTGITGGYFPAYPLRSDWSMAASPRTTNKTAKESPGPVQVQRMKIRIPGFPDARTEDIWIDAGSGMRYLIEGVDPEVWVGSNVTQTLSISRLPPHHLIYKFPRPS